MYDIFIGIFETCSSQKHTVYNTLLLKFHTFIALNLIILYAISLANLLKWSKTAKSDLNSWNDRKLNTLVLKYFL